MQRKGLRFAPGQVNEWLDCGNRQATVETHRRWLKHFSDGDLQLDASIKQEDSTIIQPCIIGKNVEIRGSVIGPFVSIAENTRVENSVIKNSIIQKNSHIQNAVIMNSMVGSNVSVQLQALDLSLGDYSTIQGS